MNRFWACTRYSHPYRLELWTGTTVIRSFVPAASSADGITEQPQPAAGATAHPTGKFKSTDAKISLFPKDLRQCSL